MTTLVGTQSTFVDSVKQLIELNFDVLEAYDVAIDKLENESYKQHLKNLKLEIKRYSEELSTSLRSHGEVAPNEPSTVKQWLTKGKVYLGSLIGDQTILKAMLSNETDSITAYQRMIERDDKWLETNSVLHRGLEAAKSRKNWLEEVTHSHPNGTSCSTDYKKDSH